ncbi:MAG: hypothetical protein EBU90_20105 [Proteobacteria bacterium]|nr:hypothetical protein [Pseudomonadota bacterium]NBP14628.1 hypothetical protein [bacterium]
MKLAATFLLSWLLSGCVILDAYLMTKYDANEYKLITDIRAEANRYKEECANLDQSKINAKNIVSQTELFMMYSEHVPRNKDVINASKELHEMSKELYERYNKSNVSTMFCKIKFDNISSSAKKMQSVIGSRPR